MCQPSGAEVDAGDTGRPTFYAHMDVADLSDALQFMEKHLLYPSAGAPASRHMSSGHESVQSAETLPDLKPYQHVQSSASIKSCKSMALVCLPENPRKSSDSKGKTLLTCSTKLGRA